MEKVHQRRTTNNILLLALLLVSSFNLYHYVVNDSWDWKLVAMNVVVLLIWVIRKFKANDRLML